MRFDDAIPTSEQTSTYEYKTFSLRHVLIFYHITCDFRCLWFCRVLSFSKCLFQHNVDSCKANWLAKGLKFVYSTFLWYNRYLQTGHNHDCVCSWVSGCPTTPLPVKHFLSVLQILKTGHDHNSACHWINGCPTTPLPVMAPNFFEEFC